MLAHPVYGLYMYVKYIYLLSENNKKYMRDAHMLFACAHSFDIRVSVNVIHHIPLFFRDHPPMASLKELIEGVNMRAGHKMS